LAKAKADGLVNAHSTAFPRVSTRMQSPREHKAAQAARQTALAGK
jgi:hypothetical protein